MSQSVVVICTKNRARDLSAALRSIESADYSGVVIVFDASDPEIFDEIQRSVIDRTNATVEHILAPRVGLARQRNDALDCIDGQYEIVHFIDDDTEVACDYFDRIERRFASDPTLAGVGGTVLNQERERFKGPKNFFLLRSKRPGELLSSGRNTIGHYPGGRDREVDWLPGCCMSYRLSAIAGMRFDERLESYSWGEDFDFSFRLSRRHRIVIDPTAKCRHNVSPINRYRARPLARDRTLILHRWVHENQDHGMRPSAFWWSVLGEVVLRSWHGLVDRESRAMAAGVVSGAKEIVLQRLRRSKLLDH